MEHRHDDFKCGLMEFLMLVDWDAATVILDRY